jgi:hypothetical protein
MLALPAEALTILKGYCMHGLPMNYQLEANLINGGVK